MANIQIISLAPDEWWLYKQIRLEALRMEPQAFVPPYAEVLQRPDSYWRERLVDAQAGKKSWLLFAKEDEQIIGMIGAYCPEEKDVVDIISVYVTREKRGQGVASELMAAILAEVRKGNVFRKAVLGVNGKQTEAVALYRRFGFHIVGEQTGVMSDGKTHSGYLMEKEWGRSPMSPRRRFLAALLGGKTDRLPVGNVVSVATVEQMRATGAWFPQAHTDPETMARLAAASHLILDYDTVMPVFSVTQEAAALGCAIDWGGPEAMPTVRSHPFAGGDDFSLPGGWMEAPSIQVVLQALRRLRLELGERAVIVGKVMGPWTLSYHMMGVEEFLISTKLEPERARRSMDALKAVSLAFAQAQIQAGADVICLADHASGGMVSPRAYRELLLPLHQELFASIGAPSVLHCCGNTTDRVKYFAESGVDCYHFESQVNMESAIADARGKMTLMGNINNPTTLLSGSREDVLAACRKAIGAGVQILSPECAVPLTTPTENLRALVEAARQAG